MRTIFIFAEVVKIPVADVILPAVGASLRRVTRGGKGRQDNVQSPDEIIASPLGPAVIGTLYSVVQDDQKVMKWRNGLFY